MTALHITALHDSFSDALARHDGAAAAHVYADDALLLPPGSPSLHGRDAVAAFWKAGVAAGITGARLETTQVHERDGLCVEIGHYDFEITTDDGPSHDIGKYLVMHSRDTSGAWHWAVDIFNSDSP